MRAAARRGHDTGKGRLARVAPLLAAAALAALAFAVPPPAAAQEAPPVVLLVPLISPEGAPEWMGPSIDKALEERLRLLEGIGFPAAEKRQEALQQIAGTPRIGPEELVDATRLAGADYAMVGQFLLGEDKAALDVRIFSSAGKAQVAAVVKEGLPGRMLDLVGEAALALALEMGVEVPEGTASSLLKSPTASLEAYHAFNSSRQQSDPAERRALLKRAVQIDPDYLEANQKLGLDLYAEGRIEEALPFLEKATALGRDVPEMHNNLAVIYARLGRSRDALIQFEEALKLKPDYPEAKLNYGRLLEESGRLDQAESVYTELLEADPENVKARSSLAILYERTGRTELAIQEFRILSRRSPELAEEFFLQNGREARRARDFPKAEKFFQRVVDINPQLSQGYAELGTNSYLAGDYEKSIEYFRQALALEPQKGEYHHYLGLALDKGGRRKEAMQSFLRSVELGGPTESRVSLARNYLADGEVARALDELNLVLEEDPDQPAAKELLARAMSRAEAEQKKEHQRSELATQRLERLESIVEDLTRANRELEGRVLTLRSDRQSMERELEQLRAEKQQFGEKMNESLKSIEMLSESGVRERLREEYEARLLPLQQELADTKATQDVLRQELALAKASQETLKQELAEAKRAQAALLEGGASKESETNRLLEKERQRTAALEKEGETLRGRLKELQEESRRLAAEAEGLRSKSAELEKLRRSVLEIQSAREQAEGEVSLLREKNRGLDSRVQYFEKELDARRADLEQVRRDADRFRAESGEGIREAASLSERLAAMKAAGEALEKDLAAARAELADTLRDRDRLRAERDERAGEAAGLSDRLAGLAREKDDLERDLASARAGLDEARRDADRLRAERDEGVGEAVLMEERLRKVRSEKEALEAELTELGRSREEIAGRGAAAQKELEKVGTDLDAARARSEELRDRLLATVTEKEGQIAALREKEQAASLEVEKLRIRLSELEAGLGQAAGGERDAREALDRARRDVVGLALELGKLHMASRSWEKAGLYFQKVIEGDPRNAEAYYSLGEIYFQTGRFELSKEMYERAKNIY